MTVLLDKRRYIQETKTLAMAETVKLTRLLQDRPVPELAGELRKAMPTLIDNYGNVAALISATTYDLSRAEANTSTEYKATTEKPKELSTSVQAAIGFSVASLTNTNSYSTFQTNLAGAVSRFIIQFDRSTIESNVNRDPQARFYERVPSMRACSFCLTMASVATVQRSSSFDGYHNFCNCTLNPVFDGQESTELPEYEGFRQAYSLARSELEERQSIARAAFDKRLKADGLYTGGSKARTAFFRANPDLALTTSNILRGVRQITGQK
jgi:hypothetical protein